MISQHGVLTALGGLALVGGGHSAGAFREARLLAERIPNVEITIYPTGGHIWLGHDDDAADQIAGFVRRTATAPVAGQDQ